MSRKILEGTTVLDTTRWVTGGFATLMLAYQGAEIIKVERPGVGDDIRHSGPPFIGEESPYYWTVNYGKKSIEIDLKSEAGLEVVYDLVDRADVFVENFRPGKIDELGLGEGTLRGMNDRLVYCSISAFGQSGPLADRPGYDLLIQALSGIMSVTGEPGRDPVKVGIALTDLVTGMWAAFAIVNALYDRERTGEGEYIDISMFDSTVPLLTKQAGKVFAGETPTRMGSQDPLHAPYQAFSAADGHVVIACGNQGAWEDLCHALGREDLLADDRFQTNPDRVTNMDALERELERTLGERTVEEWVEHLGETHGIPTGPVQNVQEALDHEQVRHRGLVGTMVHTTEGAQPVLNHPTRYRRAEHGFERHAPVLGEHSHAILEELGYDDGRISELFERGVVSATEPDRPADCSSADELGDEL